MKQIIILVDTSRGPGREFLEGVESYIRSGADWEITVPPPQYVMAEGFSPLKWCHIQKPDGLISFGFNTIAPLLSLECYKVITYKRVCEIPKTSIITANSVAVAKMAADYLTGQGHRHFAYCSCVDLDWAITRRDVFEQQVVKTGGSFDSYQFVMPGDEKVRETRQELATWLKKLPKPVALFVCNDDIAAFVLEACKMGEVNVPEEVAILGVDNDELMCALSTPPLSSIEMEFRASGYKAAEHLNGLIDGEYSNQLIEINPVRVATRQSTNTMAVEDELVRKAVAFIQANYATRITTGDVVNHVGTSRNTLEYRFQHYLRRSISDEILRLRIDLIKEKLMNETVPIRTIAGSLEFTTAEHFARYFRQATGMTPNQFRKKNKYLE